MNESLLVAGIVCIVASIVGGGIKMLGAEVPVLNSFARQALLFTVGLAFLAGAYVANHPSPAPVVAATSTAQPTPTSPMARPPTAPIVASPHAVQTAGCSSAMGLSCLPASSRAVVFINTASANAAAWRDYQRGLSTTAGASLAANQGASGKSARLCGIVASGDSSPLGKHLAAVALLSGNAEGVSTPECRDAAAVYR